MTSRKDGALELEVALKGRVCLARTGEEQPRERGSEPFQVGDGGSDLSRLDGHYWAARL